MSWRIANECAERRFGSAARKQIIMFLADKASDDGSGIWCSKRTIQRHTELSESTVKRTIIDFLREGILIETGRRQCKNGYTVIYRIVLERVAALEPTAEPDIETGVTVNPVQPEPGTGSTVNGVRGSRLKAGLKPDDLKQAVKAYAKESEGYTRSKVCFSDNWFKMRRWEKGLAQLQADREKAREAEAKGRASLAEWIHERHPLCRHITNRQIEDLIASKLVTPEQVRAAGLQV
jgi:transposase